MYCKLVGGYCCRGERSDYKVVVGRSEKVMGPYLDGNGAHYHKM